MLFRSGSAQCELGQEFIFARTADPSNPRVYTCTYEKLIDDLRVDDRIMLADGSVALRVTSKPPTNDRVICVVEQPGEIRSRQGVNLPGVSLSTPSLTDKDLSDLGWALRNEIDFVSLSFVRSGRDLAHLREEMARLKPARDPLVVSKIEKVEAVQELDQILELTDVVMVARGDLGVEMPAEEVPLLQKELIRKANSLGIPVITATQMLDSMVSSPRPTRAEVSDVANAILDGTDAVMLSNESAVGDFPVEAVATMSQIARRIERDYPNRGDESQLASTIPNAISQAVSAIARQLEAAAILTLTKGGATARNVSKFRPSTPILAITSEVSVARRLQLCWGVSPLLIEEQTSSTSTFSLAMGMAREMGVLNDGDLVVQTAGTLSGVSGSTDFIKVGIVSAVLSKGVGIGNGSVSGRVRVVNSPEAAASIQAGEILVVRETTADYVEAIRKAKGVIAEVGDADSHTALIAQRTGIPAIVGVSDAIANLRQGEIVTLDLRRGEVHRGARSHNPDHNGAIV